MEKNERIISVIGIKKGDLVYCLARLFASSDEPVLCIDNSVQGDLYRALPKVPGEHNVCIRSLTFVRGVAYADVLAEKYSKIIVYHGNKADKTWWDASKHRFVLINSDRFDMKDLSKTTIGLEDENIRLYPVGIISRKPSVSEIYETLGFNPQKVASRMDFPISDEDLIYYESFLYNGIARRKNSSQMMRNILEDMYYSVVERQKKDPFKKILAKADRADK